MMAILLVEADKTYKCVVKVSPRIWLAEQLCQRKTNELE